MKTKKTLLAIAAFTVLSVSTPLAFSQTGTSPGATTPPARGAGPMGNYGPGQGGYGPGMMGNYGPGSGQGQGGYGPGQGGYGPGMMGGGYGYGQGGYGPGMMGGGYGHGMMGNYGPGQGGYGPGMMGGGPQSMLDLNDEQRGKVNQIRDESRRKNWDTMGKLLDERARMRELMTADKQDPGAIGKQSMKIADLRRQLLEAQIDAHNRIEALLSKEQKEQLRSWRRGWMHADE